ncbi:MAG: hypothetical protein IPO14_13170 [Saprospiraceae bacterium]|nr:hypothetical protein [Saprospiraceae bacterium]
MKKIFLLLLLISTTFSIGFAQKQLSEGYIKMEVTDVQSDDPKVMQAAEMMKGGLMEFYFTQAKARVDMTMGMMMKTKNFTDVAANKSYSFMDIMGKKIKLVTDMNDKDSKKTKDTEKAMKDIEFKVKRHDGVTKNILGYTCTKVEVSMIPKDGEPMKMVYYVTDAIKMPKNAGINNMNRGMGKTKLPDIGGNPLQMTINAGPMALTYTAVKISEKIYDKDFEMPSGYKEMTEEEMSKMFQGGGGS